MGLLLNEVFTSYFIHQSRIHSNILFLYLPNFQSIMKIYEVFQRRWRIPPPLPPWFRGSKERRDLHFFFWMAKWRVSSWTENWSRVNRPTEALVSLLAFVGKLSQMDKAAKWTQNRNWGWLSGACFIPAPDSLPCSFARTQFWLLD